MGITESSKGISGPTINKILNYCYGYDSQAQRYVLDVTKVSGSIMILIILIMIYILVIKPMIQKKLAKGKIG
jgi:protein SCO1/2